MSAGYPDRAGESIICRVVAYQFVAEGSRLLMHTLWRGKVLLGRILPAHPGADVGTYGGVLAPTDAISALTSVDQHRNPLLPGRRVLQHRLQPLFLGAQPDPNARDAPSEPISLEQLEYEMSRGLPDDQILRVESGEGVQLDLDAVILQQCIMPEEMDTAESRRKRQLLGMSAHSRDVWLVTVVKFDDATLADLAALAARYPDPQSSPRR